MRRGFINKLMGSCGEDAACQFLKKKKYRIIERNYKNKFGEIDIIASDKENLIFVEVKTRSSVEFGNPSQAVNYSKQQRIIRAAKMYLASNPTELNIRFDVIEVFAGMLPEEFSLDEINHIENAFY